TKEVNDAVLEAFQGRLGLRTAGENNADAVVRGKVTRYDPDVPLSFQAGQGRTDVTQRQVSITVDVEILDQREGKTLWQRQGLSARRPWRAARSGAASRRPRRTSASRPKRSRFASRAGRRRARS